MVTILFVIMMLYSAQLVATTSMVSANDCLRCQQQKCDGNNNCLAGCIAGYAGKTCLYECPTNCNDLMCNYDIQTGTFPCSIGCNPGYHGFQCNTPCETHNKDRECDRFSGTAPDCEGTKYGKNCETSCQPSCGGKVCDNKGECLDEFCIPGRYGADCSKPCEDECDWCYRDTGKCHKQKEAIDPPSNRKLPDDQKGDAQANDYRMLLLWIDFVLTLILIGVVIIAFVNYRLLYKSQRISIHEDQKLVLIRGKETDHAPTLRRRTPHRRSSEEMETLSNGI